jgi:hypothetical protein
MQVGAAKIAIAVKMQNAMPCDRTFAVLEEMRFTAFLARCIRCPFFVFFKARVSWHPILLNHHYHFGVVNDAVCRPSYYDVVGSRVSWW